MARRMTIWTQQDEQKIRNFWKEAKESRDEFKKLVLVDKKFVGDKTWDSIRRKARSMGLYDESGTSSRYPFSNLGEEQEKKLKTMLSDPNISWDDIKSCADFSKFTRRQFRNFAYGNSIVINKGGVKMPDKIAEEKPLTPEQVAEKEKMFITQREANEITVEEFLEGLSEINGEYAIYWRIIHEQIKEKRKIRNRDLLPFAEKLNAKQKEEKYRLNFIGGILRKFNDWRVLSSIKVGTGKDSHTVFLCNLPNFYKAEELLKLFSGEDITRILNPLLTGGPMTAAALEQALVGNMGAHILETILEHFVEKNTVEHAARPKGAYRLTKAAELTGTDPESLLALDLFQAENLLDQQEDRDAQKIDPKNIEELAELVEKDLESKTIVPTVVKVKG